MINWRNYQIFLATTKILIKESFKGNTYVLGFFGLIIFLFIPLITLVMVELRTDLIIIDQTTITTASSLYFSSILISFCLASFFVKSTAIFTAKSEKFLQIVFLPEFIFDLLYKFFALVFYIMFFSFFNFLQLIPIISTFKLKEVIILSLIGYLVGIVCYLVFEIIFNWLRIFRYYNYIILTLLGMLLILILNNIFKIAKILNDFNFLLRKSKLVILILIVLLLLLVMIYFNKLVKLNISKNQNNYLRLYYKVKSNYYTKFILMIFTKKQNTAIFILYIVILVIITFTSPLNMYLLPLLTIPIFLTIYSLTKVDRKFNLYYLESGDEVKAILLIINIIILPFVGLKMIKLNIILLVKELFFIYIILLGVTLIGYIFPKDNSILENFMANFLVIILVVVTMNLMIINNIVIVITVEVIITIILLILLIIYSERRTNE